MKFRFPNAEDFKKFGEAIKYRIFHLDETVKKLELPRKFSNIENTGKSNIRLFLAFGFGAIVLMIIISILTFSISLRGAEETLVPDVTGLKLREALVLLQGKELYPQISERYTNSSKDIDTILEQSPPAGTIVKAGKRVNLIVSKGAVLDRIGNYIGQDLNAVKSQLQTSFAGENQLLTIKEPVIYIASTAPAGIIIEQKPPAGTELTNAVALELVVSLGNGDNSIVVPNLKGLSYTDALAALAKLNIVASFAMKPAMGGEGEAQVIDQSPAGGVTVGNFATVQVTVSAPSPSKGMYAGVFAKTLQRFPYPLKVSIIAQLPTGEKRTLLDKDFPGGRISVPYFLPIGSVIILMQGDKEITRSEVSANPIKEE